MDRLSREETSERLTTIRDSLYDRISLRPREVALLGTPEFLRLDGIRQLGFVSRVWPGAKHSRFEHSLGVLALVRRALDTLRPALAATLQPRASDLDAIAADTGWRAPQPCRAVTLLNLSASRVFRSIPPLACASLIRVYAISTDPRGRS